MRIRHEFNNKIVMQRMESQGRHNMSEWDHGSHEGSASKVKALSSEVLHVGSMVGLNTGDAKFLEFHLNNIDEQTDNL